jgi:hypothetical protein
MELVPPRLCPDRPPHIGLLGGPVTTIMTPTMATAARAPKSVPPPVGEAAVELTALMAAGAWCGKKVNISGCAYSLPGIFWQLAASLPEDSPRASLNRSLARTRKPCWRHAGLIQARHAGPALRNPLAKRFRATAKMAC